MTGVILVNLGVELFDGDWFTIVFNGFDDGVDIRFDLLVVAMLFDANGVVLAVVLFDDGQAWSDFGDKGNVGARCFGWFSD